MNIGEKLKALRNSRHFSQKQVADMMGLASSSISSYEAGSRYPSYDVLVKYSRIFHVSTDYILGIERHLSIDASDLSEREFNAVIEVVNLFRKAD